MLVLSRKIGEEVVIGDGIRVTLVAIHGKQVRLGITAPADVVIRRNELCPADGVPPAEGRDEESGSAPIACREARRCGPVHS